MANYTKHYRTRGTATPQSEAITNKDQVKNNAGGYVFAVDKWKQMERFLILGSEGGTYYVGERPLTIENAKNVEACIAEDGLRAVQMIVDVSVNNRAPKNDPALYALAIATAAEDEATRRAALDALPQVARIGTHLFNFAEYVKGFRGWGRALRRAIADWYQNKSVEQLAYSLVKYQSRNGWTNRDLLRLAHPKTDDEVRNELYRWAVGKTEDVEGTIVHGFELAKNAGSTKEIVDLITEYNLPREAVPTQFLNDVAVWDALLQKMPLNAMVRNLGKMTSIGLIAPMSDATNLVSSRLSDSDYIRKSRVHPMSVLTALKVYENRGGFRGKLSWEPVGAVTSALDDAFYGAFGNVEPTGKRILLALDVSGSMGSPVSGSEVLSCAEASTALALITAHTETNYEIMGFADSFKPLGITDKDSLGSALKKTRGMNFGATDCALPMLWANGYNASGRASWYSRTSSYTKSNRKPINVDAFVVYTDNETWFGSKHPCEALRDYRQASGIDSKLVVNAMTASKFSIADPADAGTLDVVGFDSATPSVISEFIR